MLVLTTPAFGVLNEFQAASAVSKYQHSNELATVYGPYTYLNHPYFYIEFTRNGTKTGVVIIDGRTGNVVDIEAARKIAFTHHVLRDITETKSVETSEALTRYRQLSRELQEKQDELNFLLMHPFLFLSTAERNEIRDQRRAMANAERFYDAIIPHVEQILTIERNVLNGSRSYENAIRYMEAYGNVAGAIDMHIEGLREAEKVLEADFGSERIRYFSNDMRNFEQSLQRAVDRDIASMESRTQTVLNTVFITIGLMAIGLTAILAGIVIIVRSTKKKNL